MGVTVVPQLFFFMDEGVQYGYPLQNEWIHWGLKQYYPAIMEDWATFQEFINWRRPRDCKRKSCSMAIQFFNGKGERHFLLFPAAIASPECITLARECLAWLKERKKLVLWGIRTAWWPSTFWTRVEGLFAVTEATLASLLHWRDAILDKTWTPKAVPCVGGGRGEGT